MLREEAIEVLKDLWRYEHSEFSEKDIREALVMAIRALKNEQTDGDLISREEVLKEGAYYSNRPTHTFLNDVVKVLPAIPQTDYENYEAFEWCKGCKEYDTESHCCHRYSSFIRESLQENINAVLEDIKTEIADKCYITVNDSGAMTLYDIFEIIDNHISGKEE